MRRLIAVVLLTYACNGDPCANVNAGFSIHVVRTASVAALQWTAVPADNYQIYALGRLVATVTGNSVALTWNVDLGAVEFEVHPSIQRRVCPAAGSVVVPPAPALTAEAHDAGILLTLYADPLYDGGAVIGRNLDGGTTFEALATPAGSTYLDQAVTDATHYTYLLRERAPNVEAYSTPIQVESMQPAPRVSVTEYYDGIGLSWTLPGDARSCDVTLVSPPGLPTEGVPYSQPPKWKCPAGADCTYEVACSSRALGRGTLVTARLAPASPASCKAVPAIGGVQLQWSPANGAASSSIFREGSAGEVGLGTTSGTTLFDPSAPLFGPVTYKVVSIGADGAFDPRSTCATNAAFATTAPDQMNLGPHTGLVTTDQNPGQVFSVSRGGQLMGVELPLMGDAAQQYVCIYDTSDPQGTVQLGCTSKPPVDYAGGALAASELRGLYFDLSSFNIKVSAGQTLRFVVPENDGPESLPYSGDLVSGNATFVTYTSDSSRDLLFKTFVLPSDELNAPVVQARSGAGGALLTWTASPGATGYNVLDATGATLLHTLETHAPISIAPGASAMVSVRATSNRGSATSGTVTAQALDLIADAENLCDAFSEAQYATEPYLTTWQLTQTITVEHSGTLAGIDVNALMAFARSQLRVDVQDAQGNILATAYSANASGALSPLSPLLQGPTFLDLSARSVQFAAGDVIQVVLSPGTSYSAITYRTSADEYAGGTSSLNGRDLCFKLYLKP